MATRSTLTIKTNHQTVHLYRHWDGYPECTGRHLAHVLRALKSLTAEEFVAALVTAKERQPHGSGKYEFTDDAAMHGDREWHYEITLHSRQEPELRVFHRPIGGSIGLEWEGGLFAFRKWVAGRYVAMIQQFKARNAA